MCHMEEPIDKLHGDLKEPKEVRGPEVLIFARPPAPTLNTMPMELIYLVAEQLNIVSLAKLSQTDRYLRFAMAPYLRMHVSPLVRLPTALLVHIAMHMEKPDSCIYFAQTCKNIYSRLNNTGHKKFREQEDIPFVLLAMIPNPVPIYDPEDLDIFGTQAPSIPVAPIYTLFIGKGYEFFGFGAGVDVLFICEHAQSVDVDVEYRHLPLATCLIQIFGRIPDQNADDIGLSNYV